MAKSLQANVITSPPRNFNHPLPKGIKTLLEAFLVQAHLTGEYRFEATKKVHGSSGRSGTVRFVKTDGGRCQVTIQSGGNDTAFEGILSGTRGLDLWKPLGLAYPDNCYPVKKESETVTGEDFAASAALVSQTIAEAGSIIGEYKDFEKSLAELYERRAELEAEVEAVASEIKEHETMLNDPKFVQAKNLIETLRSISV